MQSTLGLYVTQANVCGHTHWSSGQVCVCVSVPSAQGLLTSPVESIVPTQSAGQRLCARDPGRHLPLNICPCGRMPTLVRHTEEMH